MHGDCREVMAGMDPDSVDAIVTDPPYGLTFMDKGWDRGVPAAEFWSEALRVAKPGAHLLAFGGTRTHHRLMCAIEDAGWEIRDCVMWVYGSGFPKSHNLRGERKGWGTSLKPAWEPVIVARKPFKGTVAGNVEKYGTGAINVDGCRIVVVDEAYKRNCSEDRGHDGTRSKGRTGATNIRTGGGSGSDLGRWPANLIHDGSPEVLDLFPQTTSGKMKPTHTTAGVGGRNSYNADKSGGFTTMETYGDSGSAARFFYCAKASKRDRGEGNTHPTVKPTELMRYLCRLVTPPGGVVLDPFCGSGSTGKAAILEGFRFIGIDKSEEYLAIAEQRVSHACSA